LSHKLHDALEQEIGSADLRKEQVMNRIEVRKTQVVKEWLSGGYGLLESWDTAFQAFKEYTLSSLRELIEGLNLPGSDWKSEAVSMDRLSLPKPEPTSAETEDLVQKATLLAGTIAPLVGTAATAAGVTLGVVALWPVGAAVTLAGLYALMRYRRKVVSVLEVMRKAEIDSLNSVPSETKEWFVLSASMAGQTIIDRADEILDDHRGQLTRSLQRLQLRLAEPETMERQDFVAKLEAICAAGAAVETALWECRS
jgi:hypothetical protein